MSEDIKQDYSDSHKIDTNLRDKILDLALDEVKDHRHLFGLETKPFIKKSSDRPNSFDSNQVPFPQIVQTCRSRYHFSEQMGKIVARNLRYEVTDDDLHLLFGAFGRLKRAAINYDSEGRAAGTAFIVFEHKSDAVKAFRSLDGKQLDGRRLFLRIINRSFGQSFGMPLHDNNQRSDRKPNDSRMVSNNKENITDRDLDLDLDDYSRQRKRAKTGNH